MEILNALTVTAVFAALAYYLGMVGRSGAAGGFVLGTVIFYCTGWQGFVLLALFVVGGSALTRFGYTRKESSGTAQERGGRRGARNAVANLSVAVVLAIIYAVTAEEAFIVAFVAALGAAFADTSESEIGQLYGRNPRLITNLRRVPNGTDGAVTVTGTLAGVVASVLMSLAALLLGFLGGTWEVAVVAAAAFLGTLGDSVIGAKMPRIGNELTNVSCTLVAALSALLFVALV